MRKAIWMLLVLATVLVAGCVGSSGDSSSPSAAPGQDDAEETSGDDAATGDAENASGSTDTGDDGSGTTEDDPAPRTPSDAMPDREPAETGEGWARYEIAGHSTFAMDNWYAQGGACGQTLPDGCNYYYNLTVRKDVTLVEAQLTWDSEYVDIDLHYHNSDDKELEASQHGQVFTDQLPDDGGFGGNGTTWEYLTTSADEYGAGDYYLRVREKNNWDPQNLVGLTPAGDGVPYTLTVWVHTVPAEPSNHPAQ